MSVHPYQYVVVRCVPRAEREEFVNVGIVLRSQQADHLEAAFALDRDRLRAFAPDLDLDELDAALSVVKDVAAGREGGGRPRLGDDGRRFGWLSAPRSTVVRPGPVHSGVTGDPRAEVQWLLDQLVRSPLSAGREEGPRVVGMDLTRPTAPAPYDLLPETATFEVTSEDFTDGGVLAQAQVFDDWGFSGGNISPRLSWSGAPEGTKGYAVSCFDADAPTPAGFWHWTVVGIPAGTTELPQGAGEQGGAQLPEGAFMTTSDFGLRAFGGAAPPAGDIAHRYVFAVHALDTDDLGIDDSVSCTVAAFNYLQHTLGRAVITGTYRA